MKATVNLIVGLCLAVVFFVGSGFVVHGLWLLFLLGWDAYR